MAKKQTDSAPKEDTAVDLTANLYALEQRVTELEATVRAFPRPAAEPAADASTTDDRLTKLETAVRLLNA